MERVEALDNMQHSHGKTNRHRKPSVSIVIPAYNEAAVVENSLNEICNYMDQIQDKYEWELIFVNDGSTDNTGVLVDRFAQKRDNVIVLHHFVNFNLGQALRYAFGNCSGDYIVTMDVDLSYSPDHIEKLLNAIIKNKAKIAIASPYMKGGKVTNVPFTRKALSYCANRFLSMTAKGKISTITGMVRAYDRQFIQSLNTKAMDMAINPEIIYKAQLLRARIVEIPAHLNWEKQNKVGKNRTSSMRILWTILSSLFSGFIFRPFMFFIVPGFTLMLLSFYPLAWAFIHTFTAYNKLSSAGLSLDYRFSEAFAQAFKISPHSFIVGGVSLVVSIQLLSLGILALQNKRYFEELYHLGSRIYKTT